MKKKFTLPILLTRLRKVFSQQTSNFALDRARFVCSKMTLQKGLMICFFVSLSLAPYALQAQSCTTSNPVTDSGTVLHTGGAALDGTATPFTLPPNCLPTGNADIINNRGYMIGCSPTQAGCPTSETPESSVVPEFSCPGEAVIYKELTSPNTIFVQYWNDCVGSTLSADYKASYQGFANQLFCAVDGNGYPAAPASAGTPLSGLVTDLPTQGEDIPAMVTELGNTTADCSHNDDTKSAELLQADFWVVIPSFVQSLGVQFDGNRDDQALFMIGPSVSEMCATADFIDSSGGDQGNQSLYYNIPSTATQVCGGTLLRARMYISDLADRFRVNPEFDFGNGFAAVGAGNIYPVTSAGDNTPPTLQYGPDLMGFRDSNGNIFDADENLVEGGCFVPQSVPPASCAIVGSAMAVAGMQNALYMGPAGGASYAWSVLTGDAAINGASNGQNVSIDFGMNASTLQLIVTNADGCTISICTLDVAVTSTLTCMISGSTSTCENTTGLIYAGIAGASSYAWTVSGATIVGASNTQMVTVNAGTSDFTLQLVISPGAVTSCSQMVTVNPVPTAGTDGTLMICAGTTVTDAQLFAQLGGTPASGGVWTPTLAGAGTYTYTVTGISPCPNATSQVVVTEQALPIAGTDGTLMICAGATVTDAQLFAQLGGTPASGGAWTPTLAGAGTYTYTVTGISPCPNVTAQVVVTVDPVSVCSIVGSIRAVENTQDALYTGPTGMSSYAWTVIAGDATIDGSSTDENVIIDFGTTNSTLQLTITDGNGCSSTCTFNISTEPSPIPTLSQWGLLVYGLLILNLFVVVLYRKKMMFE